MKKLKTLCIAKVVDRWVPTYFNFDYLGVDMLEFIAFGGADLSHHSRQHFAMEDFMFTAINHPVPEPTTMLLLGSGLQGLASVRSKFKN